MRGQRFALQANQRFFHKKTKIEFVARPVVLFVLLVLVASFPVCASVRLLFPVGVLSPRSLGRNVDAVEHETLRIDGTALHHLLSGGHVSEVPEPSASPSVRPGGEVANRVLREVILGVEHVLMKIRI